MIATTPVLIASLLLADDPTFFSNDRVVVVANGASWSSLALARRYLELRHVPADHLLVLDDVPGGAPANSDPISLDDCRNRLLAPILDWLKQRELTDEIDAILYSSAFPHAVDVEPVTKKDADYQHIGPTAALTGLTYFAREVVAGDFSSFTYHGVPNRYVKTPIVTSNERAASEAEAKLWNDAQLALAAKKHADAEKLLLELSKSYQESGAVWYDLACCQALLGKKDEALASLKKAADAGFWNADHAAADSDLESLRSDAAFPPLLDAMRQRVPPPPPSRGFGNDRDGRGKHYLSTLLAWIGQFGLSHADSLANLERTAAADATDPSGTFYFLKNGDVRATTRMPLFSSAMAALQQRGRKVALLEAGKEGQDGILPIGKQDVLGAVVGISDFDWSKCGSKLVPGAIAEHLTSCGGMFQAAGQTKCSEFLRVGAAGSSGAVTEPYALQAKFPTPLIHVYYADGCSLGEAFYESVAAPYQLIIVGDACCRPFAPLAKLSLDAAATKKPWSGTLPLTPSCTPPADHFEAWVGGRLVATTPSNESDEGVAPLTIDTTRLPDGPQLLHLVAIGAGPVGVPTAIERTIVVANRNAGAADFAVTLDPIAKPAVESGQLIELTGRAPANATIALLDGSREVGRGATRNGRFTIDVESARLGLGRVTLVARAHGADGDAVSAPIEATVTSATLAGAAKAPGELLPGLAVDVGAGKAKSGLGVLAFTDPLPIAESGTVRGWVTLPADGVHEWSVRGGSLRALSIDGKKLLVPATPDNAGAAGSSGAHAFLLRMEKGWHSFEIEVAATKGLSPRLALTAESGPIPLGDGAAGQGDGNLRRFPKERVKCATAAWIDGNRGNATAPANSDAAELELGGNGVKLGALLVTFATLSGAAPPSLDALVIESRDAGNWTAINSSDRRLLGPSDAGGVTTRAVLIELHGKKARRIRLKASGKDAALLASVGEVELFEALK